MFYIQYWCHSTFFISFFLFALHLNHSAAEIEEDGKCFTGRRTRLPAPKPLTEDFSVWNFLYKNIGKDLSKVCMPVTLNEPLNMLQVRKKMEDGFNGKLSLKWLCIVCAILNLLAFV